MKSPSLNEVKVKQAIIIEYKAGLRDAFLKAHIAEIFRVMCTEKNVTPRDLETDEIGEFCTSMGWPQPDYNAWNIASIEEPRLKKVVYLVDSELLSSSFRLDNLRIMSVDSKLQRTDFACSIVSTYKDDVTKDDVEGYIKYTESDSLFVSIEFIKVLGYSK